MARRDFMGNMFGCYSGIHIQKAAVHIKRVFRMAAIYRLEF